jgi:hypothetical protein
MDFIRALLEVLIPSRAARAEAESLHLGLLRLASVSAVEAGAAGQQMALSGQ